MKIVIFIIFLFIIGCEKPSVEFNPYHFDSTYVEIYKNGSYQRAFPFSGDVLVEEDRKLVCYKQKQ